MSIIPENLKIPKLWGKLKMLLINNPAKKTMELRQQKIPSRLEIKIITRPKIFVQLFTKKSVLKFKACLKPVLKTTIKKTLETFNMEIVKARGKNKTTPKFHKKDSKGYDGASKKAGKIKIAPIIIINTKNKKLAPITEKTSFLLKFIKFFQIISSFWAMPLTVKINIVLAQLVTTRLVSVNNKKLMLNIARTPMLLLNISSMPLTPSSKAAQTQNLFLKIKKNKIKPGH